jgi:hypothetical protein
VKTRNQLGLSTVELICGIVVLVIAAYYFRDSISPSGTPERAPPAPAPSSGSGAAATHAAALARAEAELQNKEQAELEAIKARLVDALQRQLKDPESLVYKGVVVRRSWMQDKNGRVADAVCGQYRTRRESGGYGGYETFFIYQLGSDAPTVWTTQDSVPSVARNGAENMGCQR